MVDSGVSRIPKACITCAKAKVRCEPQSEGACKRCRRLGKQCGGQAPGAHRRQKPAKSNVDIATLENKLDQMVALLANSNASTAKSSDNEPLLRDSNSSTLFSDGIQSSPSENEGEQCLQFFTTKMVHLFPFVVIPSDVTAEQLRREKPFLFLSLSLVANKDSSHQRDISTIVREYVAEHIVLRNELSLDILQGLLVFLAWYIGRSPALDQTGETLPCLTSKQIAQGPAQMDAFMQLALAQLIGLRLAYASSHPSKLSKPIGYIGKPDASVDSKSERTLEERRTYLGGYYLTVMLSSCVRDMEPLRFTKYTNECCKTLEENSEAPTDAFLVHLVRSMHLADKIVHTIYSDDFDYPGLVSSPLGLSIRGLEPEIQKIKKSSSCGVPYADIPLLHYDTLELLLYQAALSDEFSAAQCNVYTITRLDMLFRCLQATKSFFGHFYSIPSQYFPALPFTIWCQFGHAVVVLSRLSLFRGDDCWDLEYVQSIIDFDQTIDQLSQKLDAARKVMEQEWGPRPLAELPEVFGRLSSRMRLMKESHRQKKEASKGFQTEELQDPPDFDFLFNMSFDT